MTKVRECDIMIVTNEIKGASVRSLKSRFLPHKYDKTHHLLPYKPIKFFVITDISNFLYMKRTKATAMARRLENRVEDILTTALRASSRIDLTQHLAGMFQQVSKRFI